MVTFRRSPNETANMRYYIYHPDSNHFAGIGLSSDDHSRVGDIYYDDTPAAPSWTPVAAHGFKEDPDVQGDFPAFTLPRLPVFSERTCSALMPIIGYCSELLPIIHPSGDPYFIVHVMETLDCLDTSRSEFSRNEVTGRINSIYRYAFKNEMLTRKHIFKLPLESGAELFVDDEFRMAVEANGLKGLLFKQIPITA